MQDVKLVKNSNGIYDIPVSNGDFESVSGIETAVGLSLFSDSRVDPGNVPIAYRRRGFVGDLLTKSENYELGGQLWLSDQARLTERTRTEISDRAQKSLQHLIDDGIADEIQVITTEKTKGIEVNIILFKDKTIIDRYTTLWNNTRLIED